MNTFYQALKLSTCIAALTLAACGGVNNNESSSSANASSTAVYAGSDRTVYNSDLVQLDAMPDTAGVQWQQTSGPSVTWLTGQGAQRQFIAPNVNSGTELQFMASLGGASDELRVRVEPCGTSAELVFEDCIAPGFGPWIAYESGDRQGQVFHRQNQGDYHVQWQTRDSGDVNHGKVLEITWNANDPQHQEDARGWFGLGMPGAGEESGVDLSAYSEGALSFDMRLVYHEQPSAAAGFIAKAECIYPCSSAEMPIPNGHTSYEWQTHTYVIRDLVASGLNLSKVNHLLVIQPDWFDQEQNVTVQIDNIKLTKTYQGPTPTQGCPAAGQVSYTLNRAANPSADQQEAYGLITSAMDRAVENYNCYSNLRRHLSVEYNPGVQTADGSTNGNIRFGARSSMHYVTAMHEIAHTFGAGGSSQFRAMVVNGIFNGANATAQLRKISGIADDQLHSDGTHFWPHGLNYISEGGTQQDLINHCLMVEAISKDIGTF